MRLTVASQMGADFDALVAAHPLVGEVVPIPLDQLPLEEVARTADAFIVRPAPIWKGIGGSDRPAQWPGRLRWIQSVSAGVDYYPDWLGDVPWYSCGRGAASEQIADYVIGALYAHVKNFPELAVSAHEDWKPRPQQQSMIGRTVAILGLGSIGLAVAGRVRALGGIAVGVNRSGRPVESVELVGTFEEAVARADDVVVALPATPQTRGAVNADLLAHAKSGAHLVNVARGSIIDQEALIVALDQGKLGFATLDVTNPEPLPAGHPLYTHPRVRLTPHISSNWQTIIPRLYGQILDNLDAVGRGEAPANLVVRDRGY